MNKYSLRKLVRTVRKVLSLSGLISLANCAQILDLQERESCIPGDSSYTTTCEGGTLKQDFTDIGEGEVTLQCVGSNDSLTNISVVSQRKTEDGDFLHSFECDSLGVTFKVLLSDKNTVTFLPDEFDASSGKVTGTSNLIPLCRNEEVAEKSNYLCK